jgi:hypothetical protein
MYRHLSLHPLLHLLLRNLSSFDDVCARYFYARDLDTDDGYVEDIGVGEEESFDFGGCDLDAFVFDEFLLSVNDIGEAVLPDCNVASAEPAVYKGFFCSLWVAIVAICDDWSFDETFSGLSFFDVFAVSVYKSSGS